MPMQDLRVHFFAAAADMSLSLRPLQAVRFVKGLELQVDNSAFQFDVFTVVPLFKVGAARCSSQSAQGSALLS